MSVDLVEALRAEIESLNSVTVNLRYELEIQKSRADHWRGLCDWVYQRSREGMFTRGNTRADREKRDNILGEINKRIGGAIR